MSSAKINFDGNVVLVTGAASGMGRLASQRYAEAGKKVITFDINVEACSYHSTCPGA